MPLGVALQLLPTPNANETHWGPYATAIARWEYITGMDAPDATQQGKNGPALAPAFVEWLMGLDCGWVTGVPEISRIDQLRLLGNGVVPKQGAAAFAHLLGNQDGAM